MKKIAKLIICATLLVAAVSVNGQDRKPYRLAVRTNLLYDAMLYPTLGLEWRPNYCFGIKVDGSWSDFDVNKKHQGMWMVSPEVRWYMCSSHRFYLGLGGNIGHASNLTGGPLFWLLDQGYGAADGAQGYQGNFYNAGLVVGYQFNLSPSFALDLNVGGGYNSFDFDTYNKVSHAAATADRDKSNWGLTQAGVSLVWKIIK